MAHQAEMSHYYETLVRQRQSGVADELVPASHIVDWDNAPSKHTVFRNTVRIPLPAAVSSPHLDDFIGCTDPCHAVARSGATLDAISDLLLLSSGLLGRTAAINWNSAAQSSHNSHVPYFRGTASGGGLYPTELYLVANRIDGLSPGIYHYDGAHHALARLRAGDYQHTLSEACSHQSADSPAFALIITTRFWKNLFKYYNFAFQVVSHDAGCLADCIQQTAWRSGTDTTTLYWFNDRLLAELLGVIGDEEAICSVIVPGSHSNVQAPRARTGDKPNQPAPLPALSAVRYERSRNLFFPTLLREMHEATLLNGDRRPDYDILPEWRTAEVDTPSSLTLPAGCTLQSGHTNALLRRETSFGRFRQNPPLLQHDIAQLLCFIHCSAHNTNDIYSAPQGPRAVRLCLMARHVTGVPQGAYDYDSSLRRLIPIDHNSEAAPLQSSYFLDNYNLDQIASVLVVIGRLQGVADAWGDRGLRIMNAESGMVAQRCYVATAALGLGCGAALGFDANQVNRLLNLDGVTESAILMIFIGHQVPSAYAYDFRLY